MTLDDVYDNNNATVLVSDSPGEAEVPIYRVVGRDMHVNAMFDDEDGDLSDSDPAWIENSANYHPVREPAFRLIPGSQIRHPPEVRAIDYFDFYFDDTMWERMVEETVTPSSNELPTSRWRQPLDVTQSLSQ